MPAFDLALDLDLRSLPAIETEVSVEADLAALLRHAGTEETFFLAAAAVDGRPVAAEYRPSTAAGEAPRLLLHLPESAAAGPNARVHLRLVAGQAPAAADRPRVLFSPAPEAVTISASGRRFATYRYDTADPELPRPYFHPIIGPTGVPITQDGEVPGTKDKHFHHTGLVLAHQSFTDGNNWQIGPQFSRMRHLGFDVMESGTVAGRFVQRLEWPSAASDRVVFRETRTVTVPYREGESRVLDVDTTLTCGDRPAVWNATPYHLLAIRVPDAMVVDRGGRITSSTGQTDRDTAGAPARWLDFSGPLGSADGTPATAGVALFDHPQNPRHPTPWLNFENETVGAAPTHREPLSWQPGEARRFRYRVLFHRGDVTSGRVAEEYRAWTATPRGHPAARLFAPERVCA